MAGGGGDRLAQLADHRLALKTLLGLATGELLVEQAPGGAKVERDQQHKAKRCRLGEAGIAITAAAQAGAIGIEHHGQVQEHQGDQGQEGLAEQQLNHGLQPGGIQDPQGQGAIEDGEREKGQQGKRYQVETQGQIKAIGGMAGVDHQRQRAPKRSALKPRASLQAAAALPGDAIGGSSRRRHRHRAGAGGRGRLRNRCQD